MDSFVISNRKIDKYSQPFIIAEIGVNHEGNFDKAIKMIDMAKEGGADAVKFQCYKAETLACRNSPAYWRLDCEPTKSQFELFKKYDKFNEKEYIELAEYCRKIEIDFLSTPFDDNSVDLLNSLVDYYKIASADIDNVPLIRRVAKMKKPIILSTGASTLAEIDTAVQLIKKLDVQQICLLHCILNYPTQNYHANLGMILSLKRNFPECEIGYSDHTVPCPEMKVLMTAYALGARVIEKHFTYDKTLPGNDHYHSMDVNDLKNFRKRVTEYIEIIGLENKSPLDNEAIARVNARRSIVAKTNIRKGNIITEDHITSKRPGTGISPLHWDKILGKKARCNIEEDQILRWSDIEKS